MRSNKSWGPYHILLPGMVLKYAQECPHFYLYGADVSRNACKSSNKMVVKTVQPKPKLKCHNLP